MYLFVSALGKGEKNEEGSDKDILGGDFQEIRTRLCSTSGNAQASTITISTYNIDLLSIDGKENGSQKKEDTFTFEQHVGMSKVNLAA